MKKLLEDFMRQPVVPTGAVNGVMGVTLDDDYSSTESEGEECRQYEQDYVVQEMRKYANYGAKKNKYSSFEDLTDFEGLEEIQSKKNAYDIYHNYNFTTNFMKKELPIDSFKQKIIHLVEVNNVVIIQGPTGSGKSTQVPQYILDYCRGKEEYCNIAVTQPRKIATINVARRVCEERGWTLGTVCGYQVGLEKKVSPNMILTFMTTGVLLQKIIRAQSLRQFTHIIIDEVHERNQDLDFLLLVVRRFLFTNSPKTKVILMSATIEADEFSHYFRCQSSTTPLPAPIIFVDKKSVYTKTIFYIEQFSNNLQPKVKAAIPKFEIDKPEISESIWALFVFLVSVIHKLDGINPVTNEPIIGSILVFLPGINEIEEANRRLTNYCEQGPKTQNTTEVKDETLGVSGEDATLSTIKWEIIPLHSSLPNDEQAKVFKPPTPGYRKVILSTNIAESSITVPDSYYVIDFCQTKVMTLDPITKYTSLKLEWASHVNCEQRAGRVGRIGNGRVYRLVPRTFFNEKMVKKSDPEIIRAPLEGVVLKAKMLNLNDTPQQILALALNPPNLKNIENTILTLKEIGGLLQTCRGISSTADGDLTFLGTVMASLPIDVRLSKLIILGHLFSCLEEAVIIAAGCSIQNIFSIPFQQRFNAYKKLLLWADGSSSDLIALLNLYQVWQSCRRDNQFENWLAEHRWCSLNLVSLKGLKEWTLLVTEITQRLEYFNIRATTGPGRVVLSHVEKPLVLKVITAGAFYPNYFMKPPEEIHNEREAVKTVGGRDPWRTVYFTGMDSSQPGPLYIRAIKDMLKNENDETDVVVGFDGSSKVYVEFKCFNKTMEQVAVSVDGFQRVTTTIPGKIPIGVYEALRKRQLNYIFSLRLLPTREAWEWAERNGIKRNTTLETYTALSINEERNCYSEVEYTPIPSLDTQWITLKITEHIDAGHFWANTLESEPLLGKIEEILNKQMLHPVIATGGTLKMGKFYAARYHEDNLFYRCKIISYGPDTTQVLFIDYGNIQQVKPKDIYALPPDRPECNLTPLGIECTLHGIQPSKKHNPKGIWSDKVNNIWMRQTAGVLLYGKVHSVVDDVINLELFKNQPHNAQIKSVNQQMLEQGYAEPAVESFLSKADYEKRQRVINAENPNIEAIRLSCDKLMNYQDIEAPKIGSNCKTISLKGPYSPLETKIYGCIASASNKSVDIEGSSVNTVLLDSEPTNPHASLLVAGYVAQTMNGSRLRLRQTSLMPSIPGFPALLSLLFCPTAKVKLTDDGTRVASILCGLGYNKLTSKPHFPSHDLTITLDTELTESELNKINQIRFQMNLGMKLMYEISQEMSSQDELIGTQNTLKRDLTELIYTQRDPVDRINVKFANIWGKNNYDAVLLKPNMGDDQDTIWPLLWFVKLNDVQNYSPTISKNLDDLDQMARNMVPVPENLLCELCQQPLCNVYEIRYHLISSAHKENIREYYNSIQDQEFMPDEVDED